MAPRLLRPKWIAFHVLCAAAIAGMIWAGFWQLRRLDEKRSFNATIEARYDAPAVPIDQLLNSRTDPAGVEWRPVVATGEYLGEQTVHIVNRSQNGRPGDNIVVPLRFSDGRLLLVNRGFVPLGVEVPPAPAGPVTVTGRLRRSQQRHFGQLSDPSGGVLTEAQRVDIDRLARQLDGDVLPMYVDVAASDPPEQPPVEPVIKPDLSEGPHQSYAIQWFVFSVCVAGGWVLAVRHSLGKLTEASELASEPTSRVGGNARK